MTLGALALAFAAQGEVFKPVKITGSSFVHIPISRANNSYETLADGKTKDKRAYWASDFKHNAKPPHYAIFDLGKPCTFNQIKLDMVERYNFSAIANDFKVEYFDGKEWKLLVQEKNYTLPIRTVESQNNPHKRYGLKVPDAHPVYRFEPVTGTKVKVSIMDTIARLDEMTVSFSKEAPVAPKLEIPVFTDNVLRFSLATPGTTPVNGFAPLKPEGSNPVWFADRTLPDSSRRYLCFGKGDNSFTINVKPGDYRVFAMAGDFFAASPGADMQINGIPLKLAPTGKTSFYWEDKIIQAPEGRLSIKLTGDWLLNAIIVAPVQEKAAFRKAVESVMFTALKKQKHDVQKTHTEPCNADDLQKKQGFVFFKPSIQQRIFNETTPRPDQVVKNVVDEAAPGSMRAVSACFRAMRNIPAFHVKVTGLTGLKCTVHPVRIWPQRTDHKGSSQNYDWVPEILWDNEPNYLEADATRQFQLLVTVPENAKPGKYTGGLEVYAGDDRITTIPIVFNVLPIKLASLTGRQYTAMYSGDWSKTGIFADNTPESENMTRTVLRDLRNHNMNSVICNSRLKDKAEYTKELIRRNKILDEEGFPKNFLLDDCPEPTKEYVENVMSVVKENGLREMVFYPVDEPHFGKRHIAERLYPIVKQVPGARTYSTVSQQDVDSFGNSLDFRTYMITGYAFFEPDRIREDCKREGANFWWYSNSAREYPAPNRFKSGFFAYRCGSTGQTYWAYHNPNTDEFNDFDGGANDHCAVYIINDKLYSTIQWESLREGLDDLRYLYTLEDKIAANPNSKAAKSGQMLLDKIKKDTVIDLNEYKKLFGKDIDVHHYSVWEDEKYDLYRKQLQEAILSF